MFVFWKICCALLPCYLHFEIRPFALLPTKLPASLITFITFLLHKKCLYSGTYNLLTVCVTTKTGAKNLPKVHTTRQCRLTF